MNRAISAEVAPRVAPDLVGQGEMVAPASAFILGSELPTMRPRNTVGAGPLRPGILCSVPAACPSGASGCWPRLARTCRMPLATAWAERDQARWNPSRTSNSRSQRAERASFSSATSWQTSAWPILSSRPVS